MTEVHSYSEFESDFIEKLRQMESEREERKAQGLPEIPLPSAKPIAAEDDDESDLDSDDGEINVILESSDLSKMTEEERQAYFNKHKTCAYCQSIGKDEQVYQGHTKEECKILQNTRCNWCAGYGHTGKYCENKGEKPLTIKCMFCFRAKMDEKFYMSHTQDRCRFKQEYEYAKKNGHPLPKRPRATNGPIPQRKTPSPELYDPERPEVRPKDNTVEILRRLKEENERLLAQLRR